LDSVSTLQPMTTGPHTLGQNIMAQECGRGGSSPHDGQEAESETERDKVLPSKAWLPHAHLLPPARPYLLKFS
jgi:hypothetical protein